MFKLAVFSVLVAVAFAKPSVYYSSPLAYSAPLVAAPSSVSSHSKTDYHNENSHSVVGGGVAAVAADPVVASVGAVPANADPSTVQQYPTEIHSVPVVAQPLYSFSNYSRTDSNNEYSETAVDPAVPSTSNLVSEQLPVVEIENQNYVANVPEIVISSSPSPLSLNYYLPPVPQNIAVPTIHINNEASANDVEIIPEISTDNSIVVSSSTAKIPRAIAEFPSSTEESTENSSESDKINEVSTENSISEQSVVTFEPIVTITENSGDEQTASTVVTEGDDGKTDKTTFVTFSNTSSNTSTPVVPLYSIQNDLGNLNIDVSQSPVDEVVIDSIASNEPLRPLQNLQIEDRSGDPSVLVQTPKTIAVDYNLPQDAPSVFVSQEPQFNDSTKFLSVVLSENRNKDIPLVQTPNTVITDYNLPNDQPSIYISYIEPQSNGSVKSLPVSLVDSYTKVEKEEVLSPHITIDLLSRASPVPLIKDYGVNVETYSEPSKFLISPDYVPNHPELVAPEVSLYTSSTPLPNTQNNEGVHIISKIDTDIHNLKGSLEQTFPNVVSVEADNSVVNIVPTQASLGQHVISKTVTDINNLKENLKQSFPDVVSVEADKSVVNIVPNQTPRGQYVLSNRDTDVNNFEERLEQTFPDTVSVEADNSAVNVAPVQIPSLTVVSTVPSIISSSKTDYGHEISQHWIGTPATPIESAKTILDSPLLQPLVSLKTFNRINCTDETHQSVTPLVENVGSTLLSDDSVPISIPVSSSSYNKTDYSNETSFTITPLGAVASNVADSSFDPASVAYSSPVEVAPGSSVSSSSRTDYHHEASRTDVGAGVAVDQPVVAAYRAAPVAYTSAPVAVAGSPASSVSSHTKTDYHHENSHHAVGPGASVAAVRASPVVYSAAPVAYSAAPVAVAASPASSVSSHTKTDYHHEDSRHHQLGSGAAVAAVRASPVAYSAPAVAYSAPSVAYSAPAVAYSAPSVTYSAPAVSYSSPVVVRKVAVAAPSYVNEVAYTPSVYARRVYSSPAVAYASSPYVSYSSPVVYSGGPASSSSSSIRTGGYHHEDHQQNVY